MSSIAVRFQDQFAVGPQIVATGYRPAWNHQYIIGVLSKYVRAVDLKTGTTFATLKLPYTPVSAIVLPGNAGAIASTPYNPTGPGFYLAIIGDDGVVRAYDRTTLIQFSHLTAPAGKQGVFYATRDGVVYDGPNAGELYLVSQGPDQILAHALVPGGAIAAAVWIPPTQNPAIHYVFDGVGHLRVMTYDTHWNWLSTVTGAGLVDVVRVWTDTSQSWPYYGQPTRLRVLTRQPQGGGSISVWDITDPLNPVYISTDRTYSADNLTDLAGGTPTSRVATRTNAGLFPAVAEWKPMTGFVPADPGPDAVPLGISLHSDNGEWWLLGSNSYTPLFQYATATAVFSSNGSTPDCHIYSVTPSFVSGTWTSPTDGTYTARFRVRGQTETIIMSGGTVIANTGGHLTLNGTMTQPTYDRLSITTSTGDVYICNSNSGTFFTSIDYAFAVTLAPGTTLTFRYDTIDGKSTLPYQNQVNYLAADDDPGHPFTAAAPDQGFLGATQQIDLLSLVKVS